jgi:cyanophycinase
MGKIMLIGGNVDKAASLSAKEKKEFGKIKTVKMVRLEIFKRLINELKGINSRIEIITAASTMPHIVGKEYKKAFKKLKSKNIGIMHIKSATSADTKKNLDRLEKCDCVLFTGGNQNLLCQVLLGTEFLKLLIEKYRKESNFLISGTSAGAMALAQVMIAKGKPSVSFIKGHIDIIEGFNLLPRIIIDTHFIQRRRLSRLVAAVAENPDKLGIGLSEDTAVFFKTPEKVEVIGSNVVILIDGSHISYNNIKQIKRNQNICLQDVKLHVLPKGEKFSIIKRKIFNDTLSN